ncbi:glycosyltransferase [Nocardioides sp.]|uniref:glycosyltransferase n=1 Tax=Nocardioides sp. TaxID=35761 RepID=UPI0037836A8A
MSAPARPRFSLVCAVYDVGRFLPDFIASVEAQSSGLDDVEVVMVDDGSTDHSPQVLNDWAERRPGTVRVLHQENAGQGAARNAGIAAARGEWISFPDPDDALAPGYLATVGEFLDAHPDADLVACRRLMWHEGTGQVRDDHALRSMFRGSPYVDLADNPDRFHGHSASSFFRLDRIREAGLAFDPRLRPNFEDGHFNCCYLLETAHPRVAFLEGARYRYRVRADGTSTLQTSVRHPGRYTVVPEHGYLDVVDRAVARYGQTPGWLATCLLYDLHWYFAATDSQAKPGRPTSGPLTESFHRLATDILTRLDVDAGMPFVPPTVPLRARLVMEHSYRPDAWHDPFVVLGSLDVAQELVRASYFFTGELPAERWSANGTPIAPLHAKVRDLTYYGRALLHERIVWLPADKTLTVDLDGVATDVVYQRPYGPTKVAQPGQIRWWLNPESEHHRQLVPRHLRIRTPTTRLGRRAAALKDKPQVRERYAGAWVLMDRVHDANDSGEILFRHLREHHPEINAWFVLEKGGPEWTRFKAAGHADRLVAHGSLQWRLLMAHATHLLSSHAENVLAQPEEIAEFTAPGWRFHFLQHGVIKDDISGWLDPKRLETFVVSTPRELASIAGDHTPYKFTTREVAMTGLPRFDRLREVGLRFPPERRDLVLVTPTWRNSLLPPMLPGSQRRPVDRSVLGSDLVRTWLAYLADERLAAACAEHGVTLGFLPHPNLQPLLPMMDLPAHVRPLTYEGHDPQELFARARVLVTDFSSIAFNAAYLERPVVYYQFDAEVMASGAHVGRPGYFDYGRDGFGPVTGTREDAVAATIEALAHGPAPQPAYQARIDATFPERDGRCCARVVARVLETERLRSDLPPVPTPSATDAAALAEAP